jgi:hypothetical protein
MKKKTRSKLSLDKTTVRLLTEDAIRGVNGGAITGTCQPCSGQQSGCSHPTNVSL